MYYLYRHVRLDKNEVFYIGIGTTASPKMQINLGSTHRALYYRAYEKKKSRNAYWRNVVAKTDYAVHILFETEDIELIKTKEKEFIAIYKNTLTNLTSGGGGLESYRHTPESKAKIGLAFRGKKLSKEHTLKANQRKYKKIIMYNDNQEYTFNSLQEAALYLGDSKYIKNISACLRGKRSTAYKFKFKYYSENLIIEKLSEGY